MNAAPIKVLLIDDEEVSFLLLQRKLGRVPGREYQVEWAPSYEAGLEALNSGCHDVCLVDYRLDSRTGLDVLREAASRGVATPILMLTGSNDPAVDREAGRLGAWDFLLKDSLEPAALERAIRYSIQHDAALKALKKSNDRFRLLFERSLDAILISNDRGELVELNSAACRLLGADREELIGQRLADVPLTAPFAAAKAPPGGLGELSVTRADGAPCFVEYSTARVSPELSMSILRDVTDRRNLEREIQEISEREQRRLGQDLHDGLGQAMTGIAYLSKVLQQKLQAKQLSEADAARNITALIQDALSQTRRISRGLWPATLEDNDLEGALELLAENLRAIFSVRCELRCQAEIKAPGIDVAVQLYRIAQEAATNAVKHGKARHVGLSLSMAKSRLTVRVRDDGVGMPAHPPRNGGMGLRVMHHRARIIGATLSITKPKGGGTLVTCALPRGQVTKKSRAAAARPDAPSARPEPARGG